MPFKGDENMLDDNAKNRAVVDNDDGDNQLLFGFDPDAAQSTPADGQPSVDTNTQG